MNDLVQTIALAGEYHAAGKLGEAEALYRRVLAADPRRVDARCGLGVLLSQTGRHEEALKNLPGEVVMKSGSTLLLVALAGSRLATGDAEGAVMCLRQALAVDPSCPEAHNTLGAAFLAQGRILDAVLALRAAIEHRPAFPDAFYNLGRTLQAADMPTDALAAYSSALRYAPGHAPAHLNMGFALRDLGRLDDAAASFRRAMTSRPGYCEAMHNLGVTLAEQGQAATGVAWLRRAIETDPENAAAHSALVYLMLFDPASTAEQLTTEAARWNERHAAALMPANPVFENPRDPHRRLRVGYVSPDFRAHAECRFMLPLLENHDGAQFEIHCYSSVRKPDDITARMGRLAHVWHEVRDLTDAQLAGRIGEDRIDILIDLTMHMENHRLLVFARRPAPVQISWLAYPGTTGLRTMDYHLTDRHLVPPAADSSAPVASAERPLYLPDSWFCYQAAPDLPDVSPLPALSAGIVTFGSLNTYRKISPEVLELWARLLAAVERAGPKARLLLITPEGTHRAALRSFLEERGVEAARVELLAPLPYADYVRTCQRIDIALDPFPHGGATTTLDLLNMGVPVLSLRGHTPAGRLGESLFTTANLPDWLAGTPDEYVEKAVRFAQDLPRLANLRAGLREKVAHSPLMDAPRFARHFEHALREAWHTWCESAAI
jgi:protein O-GlcNAc transferase